MNVYNRCFGFNSICKVTLLFNVTVVEKQTLVCSLDSCNGLLHNIPFKIQNTSRWLFTSSSPRISLLFSRISSLPHRKHTTDMISDSQIICYIFLNLCLHGFLCENSISNKHSNSQNPPYSNTNEHANKSHKKHLSVSLGNTFDFVLLLDSIAVGGTLGSVHEFISKTFSHGLDVAESSFTSLFIISFHFILQNKK